MIWLALALLAGIGLAQETGMLCAPCHAEQLADWKTHKHFAKNVGCEVCHGASQQHRNAVGATSPDQVAAPDEVPALCGQCHSGQRKPYEASKHGKLVLARSETRAANCATCHGVHSPRGGAAMQRQCDRCHATLPAACSKKVQAGAGKLACAACHDPHTLARK
ncbi:MAG TPA: cytochrome c3 family protein [Bryobacteraceae bacterium]|nr:cytochrome c3 family protein [Bryobacteraceae bacterium]